MEIDQEREQRIRAQVDAFLRGRLSLPDDLQQVEPSIREEVRARCAEADFVQHFWDGLSPPRPAPARPQHIGGCELLERIGNGAMGEVFRARQLELDRLVAVKLVRSELAHREDFQERFRREAHVLASLDHPGIVRILSYGDDHGFRYFVMELVEGRDLAAALPEMTVAAAADPARAADRAARITAELLETLAYAHARGVVHRDLKPSNVVLDDDDHPHLVDFGLAKSFEEGGQDWRLQTVPGLLLGTPAYWSPEVAARRPFAKQAPDVWAAGVMLFQMLQGRLPCGDRSTGEWIHELSHATALAPRQFPPQVPKPLAAITCKALAPDPGERYGSAQEFAADLRRFLARQPVLALDRRLPTRVVNHVWRRRHPYAAAGAAVAIGTAIWFSSQAYAAQLETNDAVARLAAGVDAGRQPLAQLAASAAEARSLLTHGRLTPAQAQTVVAVLATIESRARDERQAGEAMIALGAGSPRGTPRERIASPILELQMRGVHRASAASLVLGESLSEATLLATGFPRLRVEDPAGTGPTPCRVEAIEPITGQPSLVVFTGSTPTELELAPGDYRVVVGDANAFAECMRTLGPPGTSIVTPRLVPSGVALQQMVAVPAGSAVVGQLEDGAYIYAAQTIEHAAFWIDCDEVTCGAYHAFCQASGAPLPHRWNGAYDPAWQDLPVQVSHAEATAFAEWHGKRLPTWSEWQVAARGRQGALYPWGDDAAPLVELDTVGHAHAVAWADGVRAVGSTLLDTSWCGARDLLGNIDEWTATCYVASFDGMPFPFYPWRLRAGSHWNGTRDRTTALDVVSPGPPEWSGSGFRCAKSANP